MQTNIPFYQFRGGSSKGIFFKKEDLPSDEIQRNQLILSALEGVGIGDARQIDGLGGGTSLTSKVAIISLSTTENADLDYYFLQVMIGKGTVSATQTCGNILAAVVPFAIETGLIKATSPTTTAKVNIVNTGGICEVIVQTPNGRVAYAGDAKIDGVLGTAAPIFCNYLDTAGATCGALLPTKNTIDIIDNQSVTCIDNGMPVVLMKASDVGITGYETKADLDTNEALKQRLERLRIQAGHQMNLGDVTNQSIPKICLISPALQGGTVHTRMFIPHVCHDAIGVLAAVSVATACLLPNTIFDFQAILSDSTVFSIEHPTGEMTVRIDYFFDKKELKINKAGLLRTARWISRGEVFLPL